jgi:ankyrin repeat protein
VEKVKEILKKKEGTKDFINEIDANKRTALHFAVHGDKLEVIKVLLANGADINAQDWVFVTFFLFTLLQRILSFCTTCCISNKQVYGNLYFLYSGQNLK